MLYVLVPVYVAVCVFLVLVVLPQQGKGADVASAFGAASSQTTFGARGTATLFEKITTWSFVAFAVLAIAISIIQTRGAKRTVMGAVETKKAAPSAPAPAVPAMPATGAPSAPATGAGSPASPATKERRPSASFRGLIPGTPELSSSSFGSLPWWRNW